MSTPAGWYPDANATGGERYWDGQRWTEHRRDGQGRVPVPAPRDADVDAAGMTLEQWGWLWSVLFPVVGLAIGIILLDRHSPSAKKMIAVSSVLLVIYLAIGILTAASG